MITDRTVCFSAPSSSVLNNPLELGVGAFAGAAEPGVGPVGVLLRLWLVAALVRCDHVLSGVVVAVVALVAQGDEPGVAQHGEDVPDPGGRGVMGAAGQLP